MIDRVRLARRIAAVRDAADRIREVLPERSEALTADRTTREIVVLNLLRVVQGVSTPSPTAPTSKVHDGK